MTNTLFIPGAYSTQTGFNYLKNKLHLPEKNVYGVEYDVDDGLSYNVQKIKNYIINNNIASQPINIISHSMGGLITVLLYREGIEINKLISMSAPLGGSKLAHYAKLWTNNKVLHDLGNKKLFSDIKNLDIKCKNMFFVTTKGIKNDFNYHNDCVVSVESQTAINNVNYHKVNFTHSEILQSPDVARSIRDFIL